MSIWGKDIIQQTDEDKLYKFTNLIVQNYQGGKLSTTAMTAFVHVQNASLNINLVQIDLLSTSNQLVSSAQVASVKIDTFLTCVNIDCKKVVPFPGEISVTGTNGKCRRKMLIQRCPKTFSYELTVQEEQNSKQFILTAFLNTLQKFFMFTICSVPSPD